MNFRTLLNFLRSPSGKFLTFGALLGGALGLVGRFWDHDAVPTLVGAASNTYRTDEPQLVESVQRPMEVFRPPAPKPEAARSTVRTNPPAGPRPETPPESKPSVRPPISVFGDTTVGKPPRRKRADVYAPYGRLIMSVGASPMGAPVFGGACSSPMTSPN